MASDHRGWQRLRSTLLDCRPWFSVFSDRVRLPSVTEIDSFLRIDSRSYAVVFAVTNDELVLFVEGYQYGADRLTLQLPAGYLEDGETPEACAHRELLEESGYTAIAWDYLGRTVLTATAVRASTLFSRPRRGAKRFSCARRTGVGCRSHRPVAPSS